MIAYSCYQELKEYACNNLRQKEKENKNKIKIVVKYSKCSAAVGVKDIIDLFTQLIKEKNLQDVTLKITGCIGMCSMEPIIQIVFPDAKPVTYYRTDLDKARIIFLNHVIKGRIIYPWVLKQEEVTYNEYD